MSAYTAMQMLALIDVDPASGILAVADDLAREASRVSLGEGAFAGMTPDDGARLVEWMLAAVRRWRGVVERHRPFSGTPDPTCLDHLQGILWVDCPEIRETADEARAYLGGAS